MAQKLPAAADGARLGLILSHWREWQAPLSGEPVVERKLGGLSNDNYLVTSGDRRFVVRLNNDRFELDVDREVERRILAEIANEAFAPRVVYANKDCLVTAFVEGAHPAEPDPAAMGSLLREIHAIRSTSAPALDAHVHLERYMRRLERPPKELRECFEAVMADRLAPAAPCLCHNDLLLENVIVTDSGSVAIDWEYARPGDAAFDLAVVAHTFAFDEAAMGRLLSAYGAEAGMRTRVEHFRDVYGLVEVCWWLIRGRDVESLENEIHGLIERLHVG